MYRFVRVQNNTDLEQLVAINREYLNWANHELNSYYNIEFMRMDNTYESTLDEYARQSAIDYTNYNAPDGVFYLLKNDQDVIGMGGIKKIRPDVAEIKRMYIQPAHRGKKLGRQMLEHLLQDAKTFGFKLIQLDSAGFMDTAHHIYQSYGFKVIDPYPESEIPDKFKKHWIFMEADVSDLKLNK